MRDLRGNLKISFVAGTLGKGGAEQQLFYCLKTLKGLGADVTLLCLTRDEFWEKPISALGIPVTWVGKNPNRSARALRIAAEARRIRPQIVQSQHFYTNLYAMAAAKASGAIDVGVARSGLEMLDIDSRGLDAMDRRMLEVIIVNYGGGPVGVDTLSAAVGEEPETIEDVYEPYLMQAGFLQRTSRGRMATQVAYSHLGIRGPAEQARLV